MDIKVQRFQSAPSKPMAHPYAEVTVPPLWKVIGGGAIISWGGAGSLLTASYPDSSHTKWIARGKDHGISDPAVITAYAIAIYDSGGSRWHVEIFKSEPSSPGASPTAVASVNTAEGYVMTGGGASVDYGTGPGNLLTASFPRSDKNSWEARSKDHEYSNPARIRAYAIGLKRTYDDFKLENHIFQGSGKQAAHPTAKACVDNPKIWTLTGGGALDNWSGSGNLLTASYPDPDPQNPTPICWMAAGKDHLHFSPATITAYAMGIRRI